MVLRLSYICHLKNITLLFLKSISYVGYTYRFGSNLLTKKETTRELRSSIPALQAEKVSWLMDPPQATENTGATL